MAAKPGGFSRLASETGGGSARRSDPRHCKPDPREATANRRNDRHGSSRFSRQGNCWDYGRAKQDLYAILYLLTTEKKPAALLVDKHEGSTGTSGGGQQTLQKLVNRYNKDSASRKST